MLERESLDLADKKSQLRGSLLALRSEIAAYKASVDRKLLRLKELKVTFDFLCCCSLPSDPNFADRQQ